MHHCECDAAMQGNSIRKNLSEAFGGPLGEPLGERFSFWRLSVLLPLIVVLPQKLPPQTLHPIFLRFIAASGTDQNYLGIYLS